jgi:uncharacterized coiled-coil DUF342 family protein
MSDTPITDQLAREFVDKRVASKDAGAVWNLCRVLERELNEVRDQAQEMRNKWLNTEKCCEQLGYELHETTKQRDECERQFQEKTNELITSMNETDIARKQRDALAEALEYLVESCESIDCAEFMPASLPFAHKLAEQALAATKGGSHVTLQG